MRIKMIFNVENDLALPLHYNSVIQKNIYDIISDPDYSGFLHDEGFEYLKRKFKLFTFSKLVIENKEIIGDKILIKRGKVYLTISAIDERFIFALINGIIRRRKFIFKEGILEIESVYARKNFKLNKLIALTISPVVLKKPTKDGRDSFYDIEAPDFLKKLEENLLKKYAAYYKKNHEGNLEIKLLDESRVKKVVDYYKKYPCDAYLAGFIIKGESDIIDVAYSCGLGNKNSQGFGCIEKIDEINKLDNYIKVL